MPYFFIVPAYLLLLLVLGIAAVVLRSGANPGRASGYIVAGLMGTVPGIIAANVLVTLAGVLPLWIAEQVSPPDAVRQVLSAICIACLFIGPFVASVIGVIAGFLCGILVAWKRTRRQNMS